ncbi:hypothetical protein [Neobacillus terrae]|uniref:hypothetical protein n=1 Tax=Neobacillus terrae TaxID=3034837 RepID=UPI0014086CE8|nr:hypothetical protein [Neobacillus terrae]NHM33179.1 hypothetical protein [Neobacillus terrae]
MWVRKALPQDKESSGSFYIARRKAQLFEGVAILAFHHLTRALAPFVLNPFL